jgi:hypothetical protein
MSTPLRDLLPPGEPVANAILDAVANQRRILIVGTKAGNLPQWVSDDARILLWPSEGPEINNAPNLNGAIGVVLFFKWIGHRQHKRICDLAKGTATYVHQPLLGTGEVRRLLQPLQPKTLETPALEATPKWDGSLFGFVSLHYVYAVERGHQKAEGERLLRLAYKHGLSTTLASVTNTVGTIHRSIERAREEERLRNTPVPPDVAELLAKPLDAGKVPPTFVPEPPAPTPSVAALVAAGASTEASVDTTLGELLRMLDDAVAVLGLAREQLVGLSAQNAALRGSRQALRDKVLGLFEGI